MMSNKPKYRCTDCGGDAFVGYSNVACADEVLVRKDERLCLRCCKKRGVPDFINSRRDDGIESHPL